VSSDGATVLHAYGVVPASTRVELPASGIDGARVEVAEASGLAALVSRLDGARYGEEVWREHAEDPDWLAAFATQHQGVLGSVAISCDVLPFRIPGMYDDEARLLGVLEAEQDLLRRGLEAVGGHVEWGVQIFLTDLPDQEPAEQPRSGRDYLRRRSEQAGSRERAAEERRTRVLDAYGTIADASTHSVANPPQDPALSKRSEPMLLNSAHLVPRGRKEPFFAVLAEVQDELREEGLVVEVSGPWPAYNFVHLATEELEA
jgi:Gas vesicle synthesis protein GvpL/GvpF